MEGQINGFTILATIINFVVFYYILKHFLFNPINKILNARGSKISESLKKAEENEKKAEILRIENEEKLKNAKEQGKSIVEKYKQDADEMSKDIVESANNEATIIMDRTKREIQTERLKAEEEVKLQVVDLAVMISEIGRAHV